MEDLVAIGFLVVLEGLLSFDNALALAAMVKHLPPAQRKRALTYGIVGAWGFRIAALSIVSYLMTATWVKMVGGAYLIWLCLSYFLGEQQACGKKRTVISAFWKTVVLVELTDIAFSIDSILAAVAVSSKTYVVVVGGILGIVMMRFAASIFIRLIDVFPKLERSAYILVGAVGTKLFAESTHAAWANFDDKTQPAFWLFWAAMAVGLGSGFLNKANPKPRLRVRRAKK